MVSTGKYYTQMNSSSFGTFPNDPVMLDDHLTEVTVGSGSTVVQCNMLFGVFFTVMNRHFTVRCFE